MGSQKHKLTSRLVPAVLPTYDPTLTVRDDRSEDFFALMSDHNNYQIQRSSFREDGVTRFFDGEEVYSMLIPCVHRVS